MPRLEDLMKKSVADAPIEPIRLDEPVPLEALHTPALVIDLDVFERNLDRMQAHLDQHGIGLRAHTKMHKCPIIAREQLKRGAIGVCAAKVSEAEIMFAGGISDILITSPVSTPEKITRVIELAVLDPELSIVVDDIGTADRFEAAAARAGIELKVVIDLDPGMGRTGIEPGEPALALGRHLIESCPHLIFSGLQMYVGNCMHIAGFDARRSKYAHLMAKGAETKRMFEDAGIPVPVFTGGGTGTYDIEPGLGILTELQAGSYAFMDIEYRDIGGQSGEVFDDFEPSLFVLVSAISKPQSRLITVDAGFKSLASDKDAPQFRDVEGVVWHWGGDEHGIIQLNNPSRVLGLGDKLEVITPHCDPTVNLHDFYYPYRNGVVEALWPVSARGRSQ
ncbi:MAG: DSD1 family PLP-dependent enzyme [Pseudomonadales bacterium]|nr:DSD1 family PLP-dependent enzyme [Pseudomonadales bacterium]